MEAESPKIVSNETLEELRYEMIGEYGQENISWTMIEYSSFDISKPKNFAETVEHFSKRYGIKVKYL
jgi:hypothetical protein